MERIYLDNAATTKIAPEVLLEMEPYMHELYGNPSSLHSEGRRARLGIETARKEIAVMLGCGPGEIFFTSGGTESNNIAIRCAVRDLKVEKIITSRTEHHAVLKTIQSLQMSEKVAVDFVALNPDGSINILDLESLLLQSVNKKTLVSLMHGNNETGNMISLERVGDICRKHGALLHSDTVQTVGHYPVRLRELDCDMITAAAHKFHGPKGVRLLYIREGLKIKPLQTGGGQERGMRAGTENVAGIVGLACALDLSQQKMYGDMDHVRNLKNLLKEELLVSSHHFNGDISPNSLYTVINAAFARNAKTDQLLMNLDMAGIAASGGSACSAGTGGSHVMEAMKATDTVNIRFSLSRYNTVEEILHVGEFIKKYLKN